MALLRGLILLAFSWSFSGLGFAVTFNVGTVAGLMLQPTSNYYHGVYGAYGDVGRDDNRFILRGGYVERPRFESAGFIDQEFYGYLQAGTRLTKSKIAGLAAFVGVGQASGYIRVDHEKYPTLNGPTRRYQVPGMSLALEYLYRPFKSWEIALNHQTFVGHASEAQLRAYVAWPYHFLLLRTGWLF